MAKSKRVTQLKRVLWPTPRANKISGNQRPDFGLNLEEAVLGKRVEDGTSPQLTLFAEVSPVSPSVMPADEGALLTNAGSGPSSPVLLASLSPDGSWLKTCRGYSQLTLEGQWERFFETWPPSGTMRNGKAYQRPPLVPRTSVTESSLWPTPDVVSAIHPGMVKTIGGQMHLPQAVNRSLWPTPTKADAERKSLTYQGNHNPTLLGAVRMWPTPDTGLSLKGHGRRGVGRTGSKYQSGRSLEAMARMFPTPTQSDGMGGPGSSGRDGGENLRTAVGGQLNPVWVNWLMNFPLTWHAESVSEVLTWVEQFLELPKGSLDGCRGSDQTGMPSSQKPRSGSAKESLKR